MKNKLISIILLITILVTIIPHLVKAEEVTNIKYEIPEVGMSIELPNEFYDIIQGLQNNDEKVSKYQSAKQNFKQMGIVIDALDNLDDNATKEIVVAISKNASTKRVEDLKNVPEEQIQQFSDSFFQTMKKQNAEVEFIETKIISTSNENKYMTITTKTKTQEEVVNAITYYTIVNQQLIGVTIRYLGKDIDLQETKNIIESVNFVPLEIIETTPITYIDVLVMALTLIIIVAIICIFKIKKHEKKPKELTDKQKKKFIKLNGFLMIYLLTVISNIIIRAVLITVATELEDLGARRILIIQGLINMAIFIGIAIYILKKQKDSPKKIQRMIIVTGVVNVIATIIQVIYTILVSNLQDINNYYIQAINMITSTIIYTMIWYVYFKISKRVNVYFNK